MRTPMPAANRQPFSLLAVCVRILLLSLLAVPIETSAQAAGVGAPRIGVLFPGSSSAASLGALNSFREGLRDLGYVEGKTILLEVRWDEDQPERWPEQIAALVRLPVDVIVAGTTGTARAAQRATRTIPIVFAVSADPVADGLVSSLARPGGNLTGSSMMNSDLAGKRMVLLREAIPGLSRVALILDIGSPQWAAELREQQAAARSAGLQLLPIKVTSPDDFAGAIRAASQERAQALVVMQSALLVINAAKLADLALANRLPTMFGTGDGQVAQAGALMTYGASIAQRWNRAATYVHRILQGAKPGDLPVEQPTRFELYLNSNTAAALGLTLPSSLRIQADNVVQ